MEIYASKIKVGDKVNMHCDGWKTIKSINKGFKINVTFEDDSTYNFMSDEKIFVIRM